MVTGSHNPPDYNGFKMMLGGKPFFGDADPASSARWRAAGDVVPEAGGSERTIDISDDYIDRLLADWDGGDRMLKVVWDNGNGAAGEVLTQAGGALPGEHIVLNGDDRRPLSGAPSRPDGAGEPRSS